MLNRKEQEVLLELAKISLSYYLENKKIFNPKKFLNLKLTKQEIKKVSEPAGVFVTLKKNNELRGCIGLIESDNPIYKNVITYAVNAGINDSRFNPVEISELEDINFEISVLTKPKKINSMDEIEIGKHGVIIIKNENQAVFLPQVATEWNWNKTQLLENLCKKAGLKKDDYKKSDAILEIFEAEVFEKKYEGIKIKKAEFAGSFYPSYPDKLNQMLDYFIYNSPDEKYKTRAIIVPHAGYIYSGKTAGVPYGILRGNKKIKTIAIFAPSHNFNFKGVVFYCYGIFKTPLGQIQVDINNLNKIKNFENLIESKEGFSEHSLEVQLPFIQKTFEEEIKILPLIIGEIEPKNLAKIINELWQDESIGFVFSTDLSHYLSKDNCKKIDDKTIKLIENLDLKNLKHNMLCGYNPVRGIMKFAKDNNLKIINVSRSDSSEHSGDEEKVVGYAGFIVAED